jgi:hypothetical protein
MGRSCRTVKIGRSPTDQCCVSDSDFFGGPTTPPPPGPPSSGQFGVPQVSQFGVPPVSQFGAPAAAPVRPVGPPPGAHAPAETGRQLLMIVGVVAVLVLAVGGWVWLGAQGKKTTAKVTTAVESPIVKAHQTAETIDLQQAATAQAGYQAEHGAYAAAVTDLVGFVASPGDTMTVVSASTTAYCLRADDTSNFHAPSMYLASGQFVATTTPCS